MYLYVCMLAVLGGSALAQNSDFEAELTQRGGFSTFLELVKLAGMTQTFKDAAHMTLFAPTDASLARLPQGTLDNIKADIPRLKASIGYYFVSDESRSFHRNDAQDVVMTSSTNLPIRINFYKVVHSFTAEGVNITTKNIKVTNGFVHELDGPMFPPAGHIVDLVTKRPELSQFASLATAAGVANIVINDFNMTVFAPTNDAFNKLDPQVLAYLGSHKDTLKEVILYHFVDDLTLYSIGMQHTLTFHTADDHRDNLMVLEDNKGHLHVNRARILTADLSATNGVLHIINQVLIPARVQIEIEDQGIIVG